MSLLPLRPVEQSRLKTFAKLMGLAAKDGPTCIPLKGSFRYIYARLFHKIGVKMAELTCVRAWASGDNFR